jgi:hypothetical protein
MALANENSPVFSLGGFQGAMAFFRDEPKITRPKITRNQNS